MIDYNEILERADIVEIIDSYLPLKKAGQNYKALCPFHEEKTPSFTVSASKQIYKCFGCGKAGNVINFISEYEKISHQEAAVRIAEKIGMKISTPKTANKTDTKQSILYKIYNLAAKHFSENLNKHGQQVMKYLADRGISQATIEKFELGYALDSFSALKDYLTENGAKEELLAKSGLFKKSDTGRMYDQFRNRLIFPIHSETGRVVAFGGRILEDEAKAAKYINSPTTPIYTKGNELYGLYLTKYDINKSGYAIIVEGYTDFLRLYSSGFTNVVASLGTSLTEDQVRLLRRFTQKFYLLYDGDASGRKAMLSASQIAVAKGVKVNIVELPESEDPDSFLRNNEPTDLTERIERAKSIIEFVHQDQVMGLEEKEKIDTLLTVARNIDDMINQELFIKEIAETFSVSMNAIWSKIKRKSMKREHVSEKLNSCIEERDLLRLVLNDLNLYKKVGKEIDSSYFFKKDYGILFNYIGVNVDGVSNVNQLLDKIEDNKLRDLCGELLLDDSPIIPYDTLSKNLRLRKLENEFIGVNQKIMETKKAEELAELIQKRKKLKHEINELKARTVKKTLY
jgi:DNA primase